MRFLNDEMGLVSCRSNNAETQNLGDNFAGLARAVHAIIGKQVGRHALGVERAEAGFVEKEGAASHGHAAGEQNFDWGIEPEDRDSSRPQKFGAAGLRVGSATESQNRALLELGSAAQSSAELVGFQLPEECLAKALEDLRNGQTRRFLNAVVQIDKMPGKLPRQERTHGRLAGTHEAGEAKNRQTREAARRGYTCQLKEKRETSISLQDSNCTTVGGEFDFCETRTKSSEDVSEP